MNVITEDAFTLGGDFFYFSGCCIRTIQFIFHFDSFKLFKMMPECQWQSVEFLDPTLAVFGSVQQNKKNNRQTERQ